MLLDMTYNKTNMVRKFCEFIQVEIKQEKKTKKNTNPLPQDTIFK